MPKTTKEHYFKEQHFEIYKKESEFWIRYFGLLDFDVQYKISEKNGNNLATTTVSHSDKMVIVEVTKLWDELTEKKIRETAFHEVVEILISRLRSMACGTFSDEAVNETCHSIIIRLQNSILKERQTGVNFTPLEATVTSYPSVFDTIDGNNPLANKT
jgi:hypothetical protein